MIYGLDISKWQGKLTPATVSTMVSQGVRFCGIKVSQGMGHEDPQWRNSHQLLTGAGILVYPYHFVTQDRADLQWGWYASLISEREWDLPPALDCEAYTIVGTELFSASEMMLYPGIFSFANSKIAVSSDGSMIGRYSVYGLAYPTQAVIDSIGRNLTDWMAARPKLAPFKYPTIYTNCSSGNLIFKDVGMSRYNLWVANWRATTPCIPNVWASQPYMIWQDNVVDGVPYGIDGKVDHNQWGEKHPFPGDPPPPPPPPSQAYIDLEGMGSDGAKWVGKMEVV